MGNSKVPGPSDIKSASRAAMETAQNALEAAQAVASGAMRVPPATAQIIAQLPDLVENLATTIERLNTTIDRTERYLALADPMFQTMDRVLPQLESLVSTGNDVYKAIANLPGISALGRRVSGRSAER